MKPVLQYRQPSHRNCREQQLISAFNPKIYLQSVLPALQILHSSDGFMGDPGQWDISAKILMDFPKIKISLQEHQPV